MISTELVKKIKYADSNGTELNNSGRQVIFMVSFPGFISRFLFL